MILREFEKICEGINASKRKSIVDSIQKLPTNHGNIYYNMIREEIIDAEYREGDSNKCIDIDKIISELIYLHILDGHDLSKLRTLKCLKDALNVTKNKGLTSNRERWERAIVYADLYNNERDTFDSKIENYVRQCNVAEAAKKMKSMGAKVETINGDGIFFEQKSLIRIIKKLDKKIEKFGGINLIACIFRNLSKFYSHTFERYFFCRNPDILEKSKKQIPYGFLLNTALKYVDSDYNIGEIDLCKKKDFYKILEDSMIIISGYCDVQPYSPFEIIYPKGNLIMYCTELVLWDTIFSIEQCRPSLAVEMVEYLFGDISDEKFYATLKFPKVAFFDILKRIFLNYKKIHCPILLHEDNFKDSLYSCYSKDILEFLSHKHTVNKDYLIPYDYTKISYFSRPLIKIRNGYLIPNLSWAASTIFEVLASAFRDENSKFDEEMGAKIESYLKKKLTDKNISFSSGQIEMKGKSGECDIVIESSKRIIFMELKKKVLTTKAKSGDPFSLFTDLSLGFLYPITQTYRNEFILISEGVLRLRSPQNGSMIEIKNDGRCIDRIAVSKMEYSSFTDDAISGNLIDSYYRNSFSVNNEAGKKRIKRIEEITKKQNNLREYINGISEKVPKNDYRLGTHFKSLIQIIEVISDSNSNEDFCDNLLKTKHITTAFLDWYFDYERAKSLGK